MIPAPSAAFALLALLVAFAVVGRLPARATERSAALLNGRALPLLLGILTALLLGWVGGGGLRMTPISTDENAYLLQARLLAHGQVAGPPAPIPEFFEQPWVMVTPRTYAKYPPGQSLVLTPGVAMGLPWLVPALLLIATGALVFLLARRIGGPGAALLTWCAWVLTPMTMAWQSSYFSEITSAAGWLTALWTLWRWHDGAGQRWLVFTALALGCTAVTRPYTALLLGLPILAVAAVTIVRRKAWGDGLRAGLAGGALLAILPLWDHATTGRWTESPLSQYTATYLPWDRLGFAIDSTPPLRASAADFVPIASHLLAVHRAHTVARLPETLLERVQWVMRMTWNGWRVVLIPLALLGLLALGRPGWIAVGSGVLLFLGHLVWGHEARWTLYYAEATPVWLLAAGAGAAWLARRGWGEAGKQKLGALVLLAAPVLLGLSVLDGRGYRAFRAERAAATDRFTAFIGSEPGKTIWFIREAPDPTGQPVLVVNDPDWTGARTWIVHDLGARNEELQRLAPDRAAWLVDRITGAASPLDVPPRR